MNFELAFDEFPPLMEDNSTKRVKFRDYSSSEMMMHVMQRWKKIPAHILLSKIDFFRGNPSFKEDQTKVDLDFEINEDDILVTPGDERLDITIFDRLKDRTCKPWDRTVTVKL